MPATSDASSMVATPPRKRGRPRKQPATPGVSTIPRKVGRPPASNSPLDPRLLVTNRVYQALLLLSAPERKRLCKFVQSPYFNQGKVMGRLCVTLCDWAEESPAGFLREKVWKKVFGSKPYDDVNFRKACSDLLGLFEQFVVVETALQPGEQQHLTLLKGLFKRKVEPLYASTLRDIRSGFEETNYRNLDYYHNKYLFERQYYRLMNFDVSLSSRPNIEEISESLDLFYLIEKIKLFCTALSHRKTGTRQYDVQFTEQVIASVQQLDLERHPELSIYYHTYLMLSDEQNQEHYFHLKELLHKYGSQMPQNEAVEIFDSALHYCTGRVNKGESAFLNEYFSLFNKALELDIFLVNGELAAWRYINIVGIALRHGKIDWSAQFVEDYRAFLTADTRQNTYTFCLARVYLYQEKYRDVLSLLQDVEYEDVYYNLISKAILIITYYELDEYEALDSFTESFRVFLNRNKDIPQSRKVGYHNLIKYVKRLIRLHSNDKSAIAKVRDEMTRERASVVNYDWLLEKLNELDRSRPGTKK